jgi:hypothetical protein
MRQRLRTRLVGPPLARSHLYVGQEKILMLDSQVIERARAQEVTMVIRVATFDKKPAVHDDEKLMAEFRGWMKSQPGFCAAWHTYDSKTGKALSISVWNDMASLLAMKDRAFPGGPIGIKPDQVEIFDQVEEF